MNRTRIIANRFIAWPVVGWLAYLAALGLLVGALLAASWESGDVANRYSAAFAVPNFRDALIRTHLLASCSSLTVLVVGAVFLYSWRLRPGAGLGIILRAPLLLHGFPAALAYLIIFGNTGWLNRILQDLFRLPQAPLPLVFSLQALLLFFAIFGLPYFLAYTVQAADSRVSEMEEVARLLGCGPREAFLRVTLPLIRPAIKAGLSLVYILAAGSLVVPMIIGGAKYSLITAEVYSLVITFIDLPAAAALAIVAVLSLLPPLLLIDRLVDWGSAALASGRPLRWFRGVQSRFMFAWHTTGHNLPTRLALGYQSAWLVLFVLLVGTPLFASFVLDWGAGVIPRSWTLQWYTGVGAGFWDALKLSLLLSVACVFIDLVIGIPLAAAWRFSSIPGKGLLKALVLLPIGVPGFLWGLSLLILAYHWYPPLAKGPVLLLIGQAFLALPFMLRALMSALEGFDPGYIEVASTLGALRIHVATRIVIPMILPSVGVGAALVFVRTFGESNLALMVAPTSYPTAPLWLFQAIGSQGIGAASALEVFLVIVPLIVLFIWERWLQSRAAWAQAKATLWA